MAKTSKTILSLVASVEVTPWLFSWWVANLGGPREPHSVSDTFLDEDQSAGVANQRTYN